jgi:hypothetical protein
LFSGQIGMEVRIGTDLIQELYQASSFSKQDARYDALVCCVEWQHLS